jgi:hypothetical protein
MTRTSPSSVKLLPISILLLLVPSKLKAVVALALLAEMAP